MENDMTYKKQYEIGIKLLNEDVEYCRNNKLYYPIARYFDFPIAYLESEVKNAIESNSDTEEFYMIKCEQVDTMYARLSITINWVANKFAPTTNKIKNEVLKLLKSKKQ